MRRCKFCGTNLPEKAGFCGRCGLASSNMTEALTGASNPPVVDLYVPDAPTSSVGALPTSIQDHETVTYGTVPMQGEDEDEEERRRRAALIGLALPFAGEGQQAANNVPVVQGTPQGVNVPSVQGTPQFPGQSFGEMAQGAFPGASAAWNSSPTLQYSPAPYQPGSPAHPHPGSPPVKPAPQGPQGCIVAIIVAVTAFILILSSIIGLGFTLLAPALSTLSGSTNVVPGGVLQLHGDHFLPGSAVSLVLDNVQPVEFSSSDSAWPENAGSSGAAQQAIVVASMASMPLAGNIVTARGDGTFDVKITINPSWSLGKHTIKASEKISPRSAALSFTIYQPGTLPTPTPTTGTTPQATDTATPTVAPSATSAATGLNCVNPNSLTLGPVGEGYNQPVSQAVTLCAAGTGTISWTANWNRGQAPWLQLNNSSGQIQAPGQQQITVSGLASTLKPGNYTAAITFNDSQGDPPLTLNVTFRVQAGCITVAPASLSFTGVAGVSSPAPQSVIANNCGALENWTASLQLDTTQPWLSLSASSGTLNSKATQSISVSASDTSVKLNPGTYAGKILFISGSSLFTVNVTFLVKPAPILILNSPIPPSFNANQQCTFDSTNSVWVCLASISSSKNNQSDLVWTSASTGVRGIVFSPAGGTMTPGQTSRVKILVPKNTCKIPTTLTFTGPGNIITITWSCTAPVP